MNVTMMKQVGGRLAQARPLPVAGTLVSPAAAQT